MAVRWCFLSEAFENKTLTSSSPSVLRKQTQQNTQFRLLRGIGEVGGTCSVKFSGSVPAPPRRPPATGSHRGKVGANPPAGCFGPAQRTGSPVKGAGRLLLALGRCSRRRTSTRIRHRPTAGPPGTAAPAPDARASPPSWLPPTTSVRQPFRTQTRSSLNSLPTTAKDHGSEGLDSRSLNRINPGPQALPADHLRPSFWRSLNPLAFSLNPNKKA